MTNIADTELLIKPRMLPRGIGDLLVCLLVPVPLQLAGLFVIPAAVTYLAFSSSALALLVAASIYVIFLAFSVWSITLNCDGIRFCRMLGTPKFLPWGEIVSVEVAPRRELILRGWLWPLLPAREMTTSLTALGHYRISWNSGSCYYPPSDAALFESYVSRHLRSRSAV